MSHNYKVGIIISILQMRNELKVKKIEYLDQDPVSHWIQFQAVSFQITV